MKKLLYLAEALGLAGMVFVLVGGSSSSSDCGCWNSNGSSCGKSKFAYEQQMLAKYRDKMATQHDRVDMTVPANGASKEQGYISGTVLGDGSPIYKVHVTAWNMQYSRGWGSYTDSLGYYIIKNLPEAESLLKVVTENDSGYIDRWWNNKVSFWVADTVRVTPGDTTKNVNFDLPKGGFISGTVTDEAKAGLDDIWVEVYDAESNYISGTLTDSGAYSIDDLEQGIAYRVRAWRWGSPYVGEWWDDKPDVVFADTLTVTAGDTTRNIDFALTLGGCISGTVTGPAKDSLENIVVEAYSIINGGFVETDWGGTDSLGYYCLSGLPLASGRIGAYRVGIARSPQYASQWYSNKPNLRGANIVNLTEPGDTVKEIDFSLAFGGLITGLVTNDTNDSLAGVGIYVYDNTAKHPMEPAAFTGTFDWPDSLRGRYKIGLPPGDYRVRTFNQRGYIDEYHTDKTSWSDASLITVAVPGTTTVDFSLSRGGNINGTVYAEDGVTPLERVAVAAVRAGTGEAVMFIQSKFDGTYSIPGLPAGWYKVCAVPWSDVVYSSLTQLVKTIHAGEFYDDRRTVMTADTVYVAGPDSAVTGIDFILGKSGAIAGEVVGIEGAEVTTFTDAGPYYGWMEVQGDITGADGKYVVPGLASGDYRVRAEAQGFPSEWWDDRPDSANADLVSVTTPDTTDSIDFVLAGTESKIRKFDYFLSQNSPNPSPGKASIRYSLARKQHVSLSVYDIAGKMVRTLVSESREPGSHAVTWNGRDANGKSLCSGIYFYRLSTEDFERTKKMILIP